jgi:hypothetical protein
MLLSLALSLAVSLSLSVLVRERERDFVRDLIESSSSVNTLSASNEDLKSENVSGFSVLVQTHFFHMCSQHFFKQDVKLSNHTTSCFSCFHTRVMTSRYRITTPELFGCRMSCQGAGVSIRFHNPVRVLVESTSWVCRSDGSDSICIEGNWTKISIS